MSLKSWLGVLATLVALHAYAAPDEQAKEEESVKLREYQVGGPKRDVPATTPGVAIERPKMGSDLGFAKPDISIGPPPALPANIPAVAPPGVTRPATTAPQTAAPRPTPPPLAAPRPQSTPPGPGAGPAVGATADPVPVKLDPPEYPREAAMAGTQGYVVVEFTVTMNGDTEDISVIEAQPRNTFDSAARRAVSRWKFQPLVAPKRIRRNITFNL